MAPPSSLSSAPPLPSSILRSALLGEILELRDFYPAGGSKVLLEAHFNRLDDCSSIQRFYMRPAASLITEYVSRANSHDIRIFALQIDGSIRGAAELAACPTSGRASEAAITIEAAWQCCGYGLKLLNLCLHEASKAGARQLLCRWEGSNPPMRQIAMKAGADLYQCRGEFRRGNRFDLDGFTLTSKHFGHRHARRRTILSFNASGECLGDYSDGKIRCHFVNAIERLRYDVYIDEMGKQLSIGAHLNRAAATAKIAGGDVALIANATAIEIVSDEIHGEP